MFIQLAHSLHCTESVPRRKEGSTGTYQHEVKGVPEGAARGNSRDPMLVFPCTPRLESRYKHYPICKSDEAVAIAIAIAIAIASAYGKPSEKKNCFFLEFFQRRGGDHVPIQTGISSFYGFGLMDLQQCVKC